MEVAATTVAAPVAEPAGTPGKIVSAGRPTMGTPLTSIPEVEGTVEVAAPVETTETAAPTTEEIKLPEINDDQLKALLKSKGIDVDGTFEELQAKLKPAAAVSADLTEEQKTAAEAAMEKRMLDFYIENKGTPENFVHLKQIANANLKEVSDADITREMKEAGYNPDEIAAIIKERYYQINPEEIVQGDEESLAEFEKRKALTLKNIAYGSKKMELRGTSIKTRAQEALNVLRSAIQEQDLQKAEEAKTSSKVDEVAAKIPRKMTFQLGEVNNQKLDPIEYDVAEADIAKVVETLKDPAKRKQFLYNEDNSLNLENLATIILRNQVLESSLKASFLEGGNRQVAVFEKTFPGRRAIDVGVGGAAGGTQTGRKGHIVERGKPERATIRN